MPLPTHGIGTLEKQIQMKNEHSENVEAENPSSFRISVIVKLSETLIDRLPTIAVEESDHPSGITVSTLSSRLPGNRALVQILNALRERQLPLLNVERLDVRATH
jgi:hypothetical protein